MATTPTTCPICHGPLTQTNANMDCKRLECTCGLMVLYNTATGHWWRARNGKKPEAQPTP